MTFAAYNAGGSRVRAVGQAVRRPARPEGRRRQLDRADPVHRDAQLRPAHHGEPAGLSRPPRPPALAHRGRPEARRAERPVSEKGLERRRRNAAPTAAAAAASDERPVPAEAAPPREPADPRRLLFGLRRAAPFRARLRRPAFALAAGRLPRRPDAHQPRFPRARHAPRRPPPPAAPGGRLRLSRPRTLGLGPRPGGLQPT